MRAVFFATCLTMVSQGLNLNPEPPTGRLELAQTAQLSEMKTEIEATRKENNDSDKKHMGLSKYDLLQKIKKIFKQKTTAAQTLAGHVERIMKEKTPTKKEAAKPASKPSEDKKKDPPKGDDDKWKKLLAEMEAKYNSTKTEIEALHEEKTLLEQERKEDELKAQRREQILQETMLKKLTEQEQGYNKQMKTFEQEIVEKMIELSSDLGANVGA